MSMSSYSVAELAAMEREKIRENIRKSIKIMNISGDTPLVRQRLTFTVRSLEQEQSDIVPELMEIDSSCFRNNSTKADDLLELKSLLKDDNVDIWTDKIQEIKKSISDLQNKYPDVKKINNLVEFVNIILVNEKIDIEEKVRLIEQRIDLFKENVTTDVVNQDFYNEHTYRELCVRLGLRAKNISSNTLIFEIDRLFDQVYEIEKQNYIHKTIAKIMEEIGLKVDSECVLNESNGYLYSIPSIDDCKIFTSMDGTGLMLDAVAMKSEGDKADMEKAAGNVCKFKNLIIKKAAEKGIVIKTQIELKPNYNDMSKAFELDRNISNVENRRRRKDTNRKGMEI